MTALSAERYITMNDFTKEELQHLRACISCTIVTGYAPDAEVLQLMRNKINSLIDNYDAEAIEAGHCEKCGHVQ